MTTDNLGEYRMTLEEARERISDIFRQVERRDPSDVEVLLMQVIEDLSANHYLRQDVFLNMVLGHVKQMLERTRGESGAGEGAGGGITGSGQ